MLAGIIGLENAQSLQSKENYLVLVHRNEFEQDFIAVLTIVSAVLTSSKQELDTLVCRVLERLNMPYWNG